MPKNYFPGDDPHREPVVRWRGHASLLYANWLNYYVYQGLPVAVPRNYFPGDDPRREPVVRWRGHASLLFANWLNYYVYQQTPFDVAAI